VKDWFGKTALLGIEKQFIRKLGMSPDPGYFGPLLLMVVATPHEMLTR
jgi:hypothetical protein